MPKRRRQPTKRHRDRVFDKDTGRDDYTLGGDPYTMGPSREEQKLKKNKKRKTDHDKDKYEDTKTNRFIEDDDSLEIKPIETNKSKVYVRPPMREGIIPTHPTSTIYNGRSGSGKSTLLLNLLKRPMFYGPTRPNRPSSGYFDEIFLFAPTAKSDDMFQDIIDLFDIPDEHIFTTPKADQLQRILDAQRGNIEEKGLDQTDKILFIFEDIVSNALFMKSKPFLQAFVANRHYNASTWICTQSFTKVPRACRLQANNIFYFEGSFSELEVIAEEYCPPGMNKKEFMALVKKVTEPDHNFLFINRKMPFNKRYRENLQYILNIRPGPTQESSRAV